MDVKQLNVLLADDDIDDCLFFKEALTEFPISTQLTTVHNGEQLMQLLTQETIQLPDVLFLDLNMPRKNGFECLSEIKFIKKLEPLPVIMYSTSYEQEVVNLLYKNGAQHFIRKPSDFLQFKKLIQQTITSIAQGRSKDPSDRAEKKMSPSATREEFVLTIQSNSIR